MKIPPKNLAAFILVIVVAAGTSWTVRRYHKAGQLDVISAQAMDMSAMRPPVGAAPVSLASVRTGSLNDTVTYTGSILPYNEQDISPRIAGVVTLLPFYPGSEVRAGQLVAQLDSAEVTAKAQQANQQAREADINTQVAHLTHHLHHTAAVDQATAQLQAASQNVTDAQAEAQASTDAIADAEAGVQSAQANADYWKTEIVREKQLADAGAASQQEYQSEQAQAAAASAGLNQAKAKVLQARSMSRAAQAKILTARRGVDAARAQQKMASADMAIAQGQALQAGAASSAADAAAREAAVVQGYTRIAAPVTGVVTARPVSPGTLVQPGTTLLKIAQIDQVRVQAHVAVADIDGIHVGTALEISIGNGKTLYSHVTSVFPSASVDTRTAVVETVIPNPGHRLMPGAFVTIRIAKPASTDRLLVPAAAVLSQGGQTYIWVAKTAGGAAEQVYECAVCHMHYSAAQAAKYHYHDPMDGGKLIPIKTTGTDASGPATAHKVVVQTGAGDGSWTEVTAGDLAPTDKVVVQGLASLVEGGRIVPTAWGTSGPKSLPDAASANAGLTVYRCEKCGMTYSEADAKKNNFIDPMDGGKLTPVKEAAK